MTVVDSHAIGEHEKLLSHQRYAEAIRLDGEVVRAAVRLLLDAVQAGEANELDLLWLDLLAGPVDVVIERMTADTAEGRWLRSTSPFSLLLGERDEAVRRQMWREARADLEAKIAGIDAPNGHVT